MKNEELKIKTEKKSHFLQSEAWMQTKRAFGNGIYKIGKIYFQTTKIPYISYYVGYMPRIKVEDISWTELLETAKEAKCVYVTIDPLNTEQLEIPKEINIDPTKSVQNRNTIIFDLSKSEEELLSDMKKSHRYSVKSSLKKGIEVRFSNSDQDLEVFFNLYSETKKRQGYFGRPESFIEKIKENFNDSVVLATASYGGEDLVSWFVILHEEKASLLYAGSSLNHRKLNPTYGIFLKTMMYLKQKGIKTFDFYGISDDFASNPNGYTQYKLGFGGKIVTYAPSFNIIINKSLYPLIKNAAVLRSKIDVLKRI